MHDLFRVLWEELTVDDVEAFLAEAGDEELTWEAKGGRLPHRGSIRKAVCGLTNAVGGYLILGAERDATGWTLPGLEFPNKEPGTWVSSVLERGLEPSPPIDVAPFERPHGRHAAVIRVPPIAVPPSITADGIVYRRVSGQTLPVTSQVVLTELTERGRAARQHAEGKALRAAQHALGEEAGIPAAHNIFALALCPVEGPQDRAAVLFSKRFLTALKDLVDAHFQPDAPPRYPVTEDVDQTSVRAHFTSSELDVDRMLIAYWDGAVAAVYAASGAEVPSLHEMTEQVATAWHALALAAAALVGSSETHIALRINPAHPATAGGHVP